MLDINWAKTLPVIVSIIIIITVALLRDISPRFAAIAATMPINIPLGMWIIVAGREDASPVLRDFTRSAFFNIIPTLFFILAAYLMSRNGYDLVPSIIAGYVVWGLGLMILFWLQSIFGF